MQLIFGDRERVWVRRVDNEAVPKLDRKITGAGDVNYTMALTPRQYRSHMERNRG